MSFSGTAGPTLALSAALGTFSGSFLTGDDSGVEAGMDIPSRELRFSKLLPAFAAADFCAESSAISVAICVACVSIML